MAPQISPDFSEAVEFVALPPGVHKVRVVACENKTSNAGNPYLKWKLETFGAEVRELNGRPIWHTTPIMGKGAGILRAFLTAANPAYTGGAFEPEEYYGRELQVVTEKDIDQRTGEDTGYARVKSVAKLAG